MKYKEAPKGLCKKTFEAVQDMDTDHVLATMDRYCRKDAQFVCERKFGFKLHKQTLEWIIADGAILDFLE